VATPLRDYYRELQLRERLTPTDLIGDWDNTAVNEISADFSTAMTNSQITQQVVPIRPGSSNQSVGNQVADFFTLQFPAFLTKHVIRACSGAGYPDKILVCQLDQRPYPLELKATSGWNAADSNRRVLTSSSRKLRQQFQAPINHLLATILYGQKGKDWFITALRLDFIGPNTLVNIRLEASVSHRLLAQATHPSITVN